RAGEQTMGHALSWLRDNGRRPFFVWVHLVEPHAPYQTHGAAGAPQVDHEAMMVSGTREYDSRTAASLRDVYAEEVVHTDALIGDFVDAVRDVVDRPMTVVLASAHGEMLGEHGIQFNPSGLYDESVRVPLIIVPHKGSPIHRRVSPQVRLMDIPNTVLAILGIDTVDAIESGDLAGFWNDLQSRDYASFLMGRMGDRFDEGTLFGYRAAKSDGESGEMLKYIWNPASGQSWLYDLGVDPGESVDISLSQAAVVEAMERQVRKELGTAAPEGALVSPESLAIIRAMEGLR
ncbi:MAG: sulfatase-like hydrolase/transferase, partial [Myxococcota bacterium]|nr:sulfatase-like hydrolase/transferase [Myxococcota bacterium]